MKQTEKNKRMNANEEVVSPHSSSPSDALHASDDPSNI